ncbi:MAG: hypothetical protein DRH70_06695, partial [Candidatus Coatesbacteria bacterium]
QEFPIQIPVVSPPGVHGYINREMRYFQASLIRADYYLQETDSLVATKAAWQYHPWGPPSILAKYFIRETELPPGDYYVVLSFTGWVAEEPFIYPERIEFTYPGDSLLLPDSYIGMTKGYANISISGLDSAFYDGATIHLFPLPDSIPEAIAFYDIDAEYPFPEPGSLLTLKIPTGTWVIRPVVPLGLVSTPPETVLYVPVDTVLTQNVEFYYGDISTDGALVGNLVHDTLDPSPVALDSFNIRLIGLDGETVVRETDVDSSGYFEIMDMCSPSSFGLDVQYEGDRPVFCGKSDLQVEIAFAETLDVGNIYVDNGNATVIVGFDGLNEEQLDTIEEVAFVSLDIPYIDDTLWMPYNSGAECDTFTLCDGEWLVIPQKISGVEFSPPDTTLAIDESYSTYSITFVNPEGIEDELPKVFDFAAYPNPFNDVVVFKISLPEPADVSLDIYNIAGQKVATVACDRYDAGIYRLHWNGKTDDGVALSSGVYLYRIETPKHKKTIKGIYLK